MSGNIEITIGIDASRNRSGGARAHLIGILESLELEEHSIKKVHVWSYQDLLDALPDRPWLCKHCPPALERNLPAQLLWQRLALEREARAVGCDIMFVTDASTLSHFSPMVVLSQDLLSYEKGAMSYFGFGKARLRLLSILVLQNLAFRRADGVMFLTKYAGQLIQASCGTLDRVAYVPHGVGDSFRGVAENHPWPPIGDEITCTYVSNAEMYKHQWQVVEAISLLRNKNHNLRLILVGGGSGRAQVLLNNAIRKFDPNGDFVTQIKFVSQDELASYLALSNVFIFASSCENLPITLLEGMAAGLPIACSNRGPMPEVLQDAGTFFDPENPQSIANAVEKLIIDPILRKSVAQRSAKIAEEYSWKQCSYKTFKFITNTHFNFIKNGNL